MIFAKREFPSYGSSHGEWECGKFTIAVLNFMFNQYRIQVWYDSGGPYPEIIGVQL
jgi:hypothetical protein